MSASAEIPCPAGVWTIVATNVTSAIIHKLSVAPGVYKQTYVNNGDAAPTDDDNAVLAFGGCDSFIFSESTLSDVYIKAVGADGEVRTDG